MILPGHVVTDLSELDDICRTDLLTNQKEAYASCTPSASSLGALSSSIYSTGALTEGARGESKSFSPEEEDIHLNEQSMYLLVIIH